MKKVVIWCEWDRYSLMVGGRRYHAVSIREAINAALKSAEVNYLANGELRDDMLLGEVIKYCKETRGVEIEFRR